MSSSIEFLSLTPPEEFEVLKIDRLPDSTQSNIFGDRLDIYSKEDSIGPKVF